MTNNSRTSTTPQERINGYMVSFIEQKYGFASRRRGENCSVVSDVSRHLAEFYGRDKKQDNSSVSRKIHGTRDWTLMDLFILCGKHRDAAPLKAILEELDFDATDHDATYQECAAAAAKECGEAVAAAISANDPASIIQETTEAIAELEHIRDKAKADARGQK